MTRNSKVLQTPIIIDTDAGTDDFMAIAYLLSQPEVRIEAITLVHGLAHVSEGARNLRRLLRVANRDNIPVYEGELRPLAGSREFPAEWRKMTDELPGVRLPECDLAAPGQAAVHFLADRFAMKNAPLRVLALGPLTNLALALRRASDPAAVIQDIVTMGGAIEVPGNLMDGNSESAANLVAEWNIYCDPQAAAEVFELDVPQLLVPLDATNRVPIDRAFVRDFGRKARTPLGQVVADVLTSVLPPIDAGFYFAWDPLAAVGLLDESVLRSRGARLQVITEGLNVGQTKLVRWDDAARMRVAVDADPAKFAALFEQVFHAAAADIGA